MVMLMLVAVRVKMMVVSLMVAMVTSMGSPFAFSLANLPVFPKQQYVALHWVVVIYNCGWGQQLYSNDPQSASAATQ